MGWGVVFFFSHRPVVFTFGDHFFAASAASAARFASAAACLALMSSAWLFCLLVCGRGSDETHQNESGIALLFLAVLEGLPVVRVRRRLLAHPGLLGALAGALAVNVALVAA